jgi:hypothetical protein
MTGTRNIFTPIFASGKVGVDGEPREIKAREESLRCEVAIGIEFKLAIVFSRSLSDEEIDLIFGFLERSICPIFILFGFISRGDSI